MSAATTCTLLSIVAGAVAANGPLILGFISGWMGNESSFVSWNRRPPMDSNLRVSGHLAILGSVIGGVVVCFCGTGDTSVAILSGFVSFFAASRYAFQYARNLNRFYLNRARTLLIENDLIGAAEDAREVIRSSAALRSQAKSVLRATEQVREFQPTRDPVEALVATSTLVTD